jgi:hypothetical protein
MWAELKKLVHDCLTENNGQTYCPFRLATAFMITTGWPSFLAMSFYSVWHSKSFDMVSFGTAFAAMLAGTAILVGGITVKSRYENQLGTQQ